MAASDDKEKLIQALIALSARRDPASLSVREIAAQAGVNHGLVHRHFGSKRALVQAAVSRISAEIHGGDPQSGQLSAWTFRILKQNPAFSHVAARACLDADAELLAMAAPDPQRLASIVAPIRRALTRSGLTGAVDPHVVNALATAAFLGWFTFRPLLAQGFGLPDDADAQLEMLLRQLDAVMSQ